LKAKHLCTLQLLLGTTLKEEYLHTAVATEGPFESRVLTHSGVARGAPGQLLLGAELC